MRAEGYAYAIIGGVGPAAFFEKLVKAQVIDGSTPAFTEHATGVSRGTDCSLSQR
jgi:hypothetical protein